MYEKKWRCQSRKTAGRSHPDSGWKDKCRAKWSQTQTTKQDHVLRLRVVRGVECNICLLLCNTLRVVLKWEENTTAAEGEEQSITKSTYWWFASWNNSNKCILNPEYCSISTFTGLSQSPVSGLFIKFYCVRRNVGCEWGLMLTFGRGCAIVLRSNGGAWHRSLDPITE